MGPILSKGKNRSGQSSIIQNMLEKVEKQRIASRDKEAPNKELSTGFEPNRSEKPYDELQKYIEQLRIRIFFIGLISSGKSTLINALVGGELLPNKSQECTRTVIRLRYLD